MCMMGLFVILWVLKPGQAPKPGEPGSEELTKMLAAIREAFGYIPDPSSREAVDMQMLLNKLERMKLNGPGEKGKNRQESKGAEGTDPEVMTIRKGKQAAVGGRINFDKGDPKIDKDGLAALDQIAEQIRGHRNIVVIKGHTALDDLGENATDEQKMDLSLRRAQAANDYLTSKGVAPVILRVAGCSTFEPVQQRAYTSDLQALNRRVEVEVTSTLVEQLQDAPPTPTKDVANTPAAPAPGGEAPATSK